MATTAGSDNMMTYLAQIVHQNQQMLAKLMSSEKSNTATNQSIIHMQLNPTPMPLSSVLDMDEWFINLERQHNHCRGEILKAFLQTAYGIENDLSIRDLHTHFTYRQFNETLTDSTITYTNQLLAIPLSNNADHIKRMRHVWQLILLATLRRSLRSQPTSSPMSSQTLEPPNITYAAHLQSFIFEQFKEQVANNAPGHLKLAIRQTHEFNKLIQLIETSWPTRSAMTLSIETKPNQPPFTPNYGSNKPPPQSAAKTCQIHGQGSHSDDECITQARKARNEKFCTIHNFKGHDTAECSLNSRQGTFQTNKYRKNNVFATEVREKTTPDLTILSEENIICHLDTKADICLVKSSVAKHTFPIAYSPNIIDASGNRITVNKATILNFKAQSNIPVQIFCYCFDNLPTTCLISRRAMIEDLGVAISIPSHLSADKHVFTIASATLLPVANVPPAEIHLVHPDQPPIRAKPYVYPYSYIAQADQAISQMLKDGVIVPSTSPWASRPRLVFSENKEMRLCGNYIPLNNVISSHAYPLPNLDSTLQRMSSYKWFCKIDLRKGFWQIPLANSSQPLTAFYGPRGLYQYTRLPFGLKTAPAIFQKAIDDALRHHYGFAAAYIDDIIIGGNSKEECAHHCDLVVETLSSSNFTINRDKSMLTPQRTIDFVGHTITNNTISIASKHISAITTLPCPNTEKQLRSFLGFANCFRKWVPRLAELMQPLYSALSRQTFPLDFKETKTVERIKTEIANIPKLHAFDTNKPVVLDTDASARGIGACLQQEINGSLCPIAYASIAFNKSQSIWPPRELEAYAIIWSLKHFKQFLINRPITIRTDHESLQWIRKAERGRIARWNSELDQYDATIIYKKGSSMQLVDYLSRNPEKDPLGDQIAEEMTPYNDGEVEVFAAINETTTALSPEDTIPRLHKYCNLQANDLIPYYAEDPELNQLLTTKVLVSKHQLYWANDLIYVPAAIRTKVLHDFHNPYSNHLGTRKMNRFIRTTFYWPTMKEDINNFIKQCETCQRDKGGEKPKQPSLHIQPTKPLDTLLVDFYGPFEIQNKQEWILNILDLTTRFWQIAFVPHCDSPYLWRALFDKWFAPYCLPRRVISDNGSAFTSTFTMDQAAKHGIEWLHNAPYHPISRAPVEIVNRYLNVFFRSKHKGNFRYQLHKLVSDYNSTYHEALKMPPISALFGKDLPNPLYSPTQMLEDIDSHHHKLQTYRNTAMNNLKQQQDEIDNKLKRIRLEPKIGHIVRYSLHPKNKHDPIWSETTTIVDVDKERKLVRLNDPSDPEKTIIRSWDQIRTSLQTTSNPELNESELLPQTPLRYRQNLNDSVTELDIRTSLSRRDPEDDNEDDDGDEDAGESKFEISPTIINETPTSTALPEDLSSPLTRTDLHYNRPYGLKRQLTFFVPPSSKRRHINYIYLDDILPPVPP